MQNIIDLTKKASRHSLTRYILVGGTTFAIDIGLFWFLHDVAGWNIFLANTVSYWSAIAFNFLANRLWTFKAQEVAISRNLALYLGLLIFNFAFSSGFLMAATAFGLDPRLAKVCATGLQTLWTYIAYNKIVFKKHET